MKHTKQRAGNDIPSDAAQEIGTLTSRAEANVEAQELLTEAELHELLLKGEIPSWLRQKGVKSFVLPTKELTFERAETLRRERGADLAVTYDFHPWGATKDQIEDMEKNPDKYPHLDHSDHHSFSAKPRPLGRELTTTEIIFDKVADPQSKLARAMKDNKSILMLTPQMNLDPDGFLSDFIVTYPKIATKQRQLILDAARFTDYEFFGSRKFDGKYRLDQEPLYVRVGYALLQLINEQNRLLVKRSLNMRDLNALKDENGHALELDQSRALIRQALIAEFKPESVQEMFDAIHQILPLILQDPEQYLQDTKADEKYVRRLRKIHEYATQYTKLDTSIAGTSKGGPLMAIYDAPDRADILYTQDPSTNDRTYDWLAAGAATSGLMADQAPLHLSCPVNKVSGTFVLSVPYATQRNPSMSYDVRPVMARLNEREPGTWGGRAEVILNYKPTALGAQDIIRIAREARNDIEKKKNPSA